MQNKDWQNRLVEMEITPPAKSWQKFSEQKRRTIRKQKLTTAAVAAIAIGITLSGIFLLNRSESIVTSSIQSEMKLDPNSKLGKSTTGSIPQVDEQSHEATSANSTSKSNHLPTLDHSIHMDDVRDCVIPLEIVDDVQMPAFSSDFPYNGKVKNQIDVDSMRSPVPQYFPNLNIVEPVVAEPKAKNNTPAAILEEALFELPEIPNLCTPNGDENNDQLCPLEKFPEGLAIGWALIKNGQVIRTFGNNECWDGNNVGGFPMDGGNYGVEIYYKSNISNPHILRKSMECLLMR
jgi:hypothetical protein